MKALAVGLSFLAGLLASTCFGQISAPERVAEHTLVTVKNELAEAQAVYTVFGPGMTLVETKTCGNEAYFTGPPGKYAIIVTLLTKDNKLKQSQAFTIIGAGPVPIPVPPVPGPDPPVPPVPPVPVPVVEVLGFNTISFEQASALAKKDLVAAMAQNYADGEIAIAQGVAGVPGKPKTVPEAIEFMKLKNRATLGTRVPEWEPFLKAWAARANFHNAGGTMVDVQSYAQAFKETADGLKRVR